MEVRSKGVLVAERSGVIGRAFAENFTERGELGASLSVWKDGEEVLSLARGYRGRDRERAWESSTLVPFWSATKGLAATCALKAADEAGIALGDPVVSVWPGFGRAGKSGITLEQILSHQAGLVALDQDVSMYEYEAVISAIEDQRPHWRPGEAHGYHPRVFGFLLDEIVRRVTGKKLGEYFREQFGRLLGLDLWIGLPREQHSRVATLYAGKMSDPDGEADFYKAFATPGSLTRRAFASPAGLPAVSGMNAPEAWSAGWPAMGGVGTASSLAKFYAVLAAGGTWGGERFVSEAVAERMSSSLVTGADQVFLLPTAFSAGFMKDAPDGHKRLFGSSASAFGHPGAGGSLAFADPENGIAFAYEMNQRSYGARPGPRALSLVDAIYG